MKSVAILGYGTIGSGVYEVIEKNSKFILDTYNEFVNISNVLVRDLSKYENHKNYSIFTDNFSDIINSDCDIVIEVMGGINPAFEYVEKSIMARKHVVTANKDLIAEKGEYLHELAKQHQVTLNYEASVGGGIPILKTLNESLVAHKVKRITGILNGTTNFILSQMHNDGLEYKDALGNAQDLGFAESDPSSDVLGFDSARKLSILTKLSLNKALNVKDIIIDGITNIDAKDIDTAKQLGYKIKLISMCITYENCIHAFVKPAYVEANSMLGHIDNEYNAISLDIEDVGNMTFSGKGAGKEPTAGAIFGDIIDIIINDKKHKENKLETDFSICHYSQGPNDWLVRMYSLNDALNLDNIFKHFNQVNVEIKDFSDPHDLAFSVKGISESNLFEILNKLKNLNTISVSKYFMML